MKDLLNDVLGPVAIPDMLDGWEGATAWMVIITGMLVIRFGAMLLPEWHPIRVYITGSQELFLESVRPTRGRDPERVPGLTGS